MGPIRSYRGYSIGFTKVPATDALTMTAPFSANFRRANAVSSTHRPGENLGCSEIPDGPLSRALTDVRVAGGPQPDSNQLIDPRSLSGRKRRQTRRLRRARIGSLIVVLYVGRFGLPGLRGFHRGRRRDTRDTHRDISLAVARL